jgi:hypothetical protein
MSWIRKHRPSPATAVALAALVVALGGVAFAAIPDSNGTIHSCYQKNNGSLRVVDSGTACRGGEAALSWTSGAGPVRTFGQIRVSGDGRAVLFAQGPFTFTGRCRLNVSFPEEPGTPAHVANVAEILVSTSEDHAAIGGTQQERHPDLHPGEEQAFLTVGGTLPREPFLSDQIGAIAPSGASLSGVLYAGVDVQGRPGECVFGGHYVVG